MIQPTHLDLDAARAAAEAVIQNDGGAECYLLEEELLRVFPPKAMIEVFDRLRKAEAAREGWKLVPDYKVGMRVTFGGEEYKIFAIGDKPGTFDICHPTDNHRDRWVNVPPEMLQPLAAAPDCTPTDSADSEGRAMNEETWKRATNEALMVARMTIQGVIAHPSASREEREKSLGIALNALGEIEETLSKRADSATERKS
jgi:hypothetical protein